MSTLILRAMLGRIIASDVTITFEEFLQTFKIFS